MPEERPMRQDEGKREGGEWAFDLLLMVVLMVCWIFVLAHP